MGPETEHRPRRELGLSTIFTASTVALALLLAGLSWVSYRTATGAVLSASRGLMSERGARVAFAVERALSRGDDAIAALEARLGAGVVALDGPGLEAGLYALLVSEDELAEATVTQARGEDFDGDGRRRLAPTPRAQLSVVRRPDGALWTLRVTATPSGFAREVRRRAPGGLFADGEFVPDLASGLADPTAHATFRTPARKGAGMVRSDLHWTQLDDDGAEAPRVVVSTQKPLESRDGRFLGVMRVAVLTADLARLVRAAGDSRGYLFLCDARGRLITRPDRPGVLVEDHDDLRVGLDDAPLAIRRVLAHPELGEAVARSRTATVDVDGRSWAAAFEPIRGTQDWIAVVATPEDDLLGELPATLSRFLAIALAVMSAILLGGLATLRMVRGAFSRVVRRTAELEDFRFAPSADTSRIREVREALGRLELAKTAMRAMSHYVPVALVRRLYREGREPELGGAPRTVTLAFTDIAGFTAISESLPPARLARILGRYLDVVTSEVHAHRGIIDKYIGDAVMAMWNAPDEVPDDAVQACAAALRVQEALTALFASDDWAGQAPFVTRIGLHRARVVVGHFGSADRMSYTAVGDGVNLAARLEGLNKVYGTRILVSSTIEELTRTAFVLRRIDVVAVVGRREGSAVFELVGRVGEVPDRIQARLTGYERALDRYRAGDFQGAGELFAAVEDDPPARALAARCRLLAASPPADWDGIWRPSSK